jgi:tetratricopeptide (TPR) repeat protein
VVLSDRIQSPAWLTAASLAAVAALAAALYLPFLGNPPIFDDKVFFSGFGFYNYARFPFGLGVRYPPYFSLAWTHVIFGSIGTHRLVSLALHVGCAWALFALLRSLEVRRLAAFAGAALFAVHPVAVYGAAYLTQRSIVVATLFALLSLLMFLRGLRSGSLSDALVAALLSSLSVLSKEHAVLLPAAAVALVPLTAVPQRFALRYSSLFLVACAPAATLVFLLSRGILGAVYEPHFDSIVLQIGTESASSPWMASALVQAGLLFKYLYLWLLPSTAEMALDLRIDFAQYWALQVALPAVLCYVAFGALAVYLILRRGRLALPAWGLLYVWILFAVEFTAVRFQEPFVLYRSYLWAPGIAVAVAAAADRLPPRLLLALLVPALALLSWQAHDRLRTFSSGLAVWEDAAGKLPAESVPGGYRTLYEVGREYLYAGRTMESLTVVERCIRQYPRVFDCAFARAAVQIEMKEYAQALPSMLYAMSLRPGDAASRMYLGYALENLGCRNEAVAQYRVSLAMGFRGAQHHLDRIESPGKGLLAPTANMPEQVDCTDLLKRNPIPRSGVANAGSSG